MFKKLICKLIGHHVRWSRQVESYKLTGRCKRCRLILSKTNKVKVRYSYVTRDANKLSLKDHYASISDVMNRILDEPETVQVYVIEPGEY